MKIKTKITALLASLTLLASCKDYEEYSYRHTVGEENNAITLMAGISEPSAKVQTRAGEDLHVPFSAKTQMRLYVEGTWTGKSPETITQYTNCTTKTATSKYDGVTGEANDIHPLEGYTPMLYWDDYGTADPNNTTSRANGLAVYGVAVEGLSTLPTELSSIKKDDTNGDSWTSLTWSVNTDGTNVLSKDIIVSNNHRDNNTSTGTGIKFTERNTPANNILEYQHMMSKVTFVLTAREGFTNGKFTSTPEVTLTRNKTGESKTEWCITEGTVNIKAATAQGAATPVVGTVKQQHKATTEAGVVTEEALIYPGSCFGTSDNDVIASINADGNIFYVTAKAIRAKLLELNPSTTEYKTQSGVNYIINVTIDKTEIHVTATVADWTTVEAQAEIPKINVTGNIGTATADDNTKQVMNSFGFYLADASNSTPSYTKAANAAKPDNGADGTTIWQFKDESNNPISLYWPNHQTHYHMRGVSPASTTVSSGKIAVSNINYDAATTSMSNLLVGAPVIAANTMCGNGDHTAVDMSTGGICAREGKINLTFDYMMSQLEVRLTTAASTAPEYVNLTNAKVELVNVYNAGEVDIHTKTVTATGSTGDFEVKHVDGEDANYRHSAIVPQDLTFTTAGATTNLRFKITIYKNGVVADGVDDIYYADIKPILVKEEGETTAHEITKWESGKHYIYTLTLSKTAIKVTATITDWKEVKASQNIWF